MHFPGPEESVGPWEAGVQCNEASEGEVGERGMGVI